MVKAVKNSTIAQALKIEYLKEQQDNMFDEKRYGCKYLDRNRYREIYGNSLKEMEKKLKELKLKQEARHSSQA